MLRLRRGGIPCEAVADFVVDAQGAVQNAVALRSTHPEFGASAVQAVSKWKFKPGKKRGADWKLVVPAAAVEKYSAMLSGQPPAKL